MFCGFAGCQENCQAVDQQRPRQALDHRGEHGVKIGFGAKLTAKFDQGAAIVISCAIKELVEAILNPLAYRVK